MREETFEQAMRHWINKLNESLPDFKELIQGIRDEGDDEDKGN